MSDSITYVVCWDEVFDNTVHIEEQLLEAKFDYFVINKSSFKTNSPCWLQAKNTRYYGHFFDALHNFVTTTTTNKVFIFNAGDSRWPRISEYTEEIERLFKSDSLIGVLSPDQTNDPFTGSGSLILNSKLHSGLYLATLTNGIFVALEREIAELTYEYMLWAKKVGIDFYTMTSGWGLDYVYSAISYMTGKKVYKDSNVKMSHPDGSGYNYEIATKEANTVMETFARFWEETRGNGDNVRDLFSVFIRKVHEKESYKVSLEEVYVNDRRPEKI